VTPDHAAATYGYLTTKGRISGQDHTVEIWFAEHGGTLYLLSGSGGRSDWCLNLAARPSAEFTIDSQPYPVSGRLVTDADEDARARRAVFEKYQPVYDGDLVEWRDESAPYALDLTRS
jgi:deazaflavin-dependent oxidoreductase (nitroreductase family)